MLVIRKPEHITPEDSVAAFAQSNVAHVDLRGGDECADAYLAGSCYVPLEEVPCRLGALAVGAPVALVWRPGGRRYRATRAAAKHGGDALNLGRGRQLREKAGLSIERTSRLPREHAGQRR